MSVRNFSSDATITVGEYVGSHENGYKSQDCHEISCVYHSPVEFSILIGQKINNKTNM